MAHGVVAEVAGQPAAKTRQARAQRHLETLLVSLNEVQRVQARGLDHLAVGHHFGDSIGAKAAGPQQCARWQTNEAVASKALTAHHRFEQKAVLAAVFGKGQFEVERERGFEVGKGLDHQGNAVVALLRQAFEFKFGDQNMSFRRGLRSDSTTRFIQNASHWLWGREAQETDLRSGASEGDVSAGRDARGRRSGAQQRAAAPGPGSPVATTCTCDAVNEHVAQSVAKASWSSEST